MANVTVLNLTLKCLMIWMGLLWLWTDLRPAVTYRPMDLCVPWDKTSLLLLVVELDKSRYISIRLCGYQEIWLLVNMKLTYSCSKLSAVRRKQNKTEIHCWYESRLYIMCLLCEIWGSGLCHCVDWRIATNV